MIKEWGFVLKPGWSAALRRALILLGYPFALGEATTESTLVSYIRRFLGDVTFVAVTPATYTLPTYSVSSTLRDYVKKYLGES